MINISFEDPQTCAISSPILVVVSITRLSDLLLVLLFGQLYSLRFVHKLCLHEEIIVSSPHLT